MGTGFMIMLSVMLIVGAVVGVVAQRRAQRGRRPSDLDAEAEANHWLVRLGGGLVPPDVRVWVDADETAGRALTDAAECHRAARVRLAAASTAGEYAEVTRVAKEGLEHLREARTALGLGPVPVPATSGSEAARRSAVGAGVAATSA
ncbi:hypothetical protein OG562_21690 [Streptomyces sp. NBC_01275]|uniref:hypothetical protein n=1 Tax=Streptomyces sp. NBC_01275 TaxID=2903807 RepID=UPI0022542E55|nr:hypothetical protein [Streptomyces sp. NBC_01275]MCX4763527.1 hypothetical protein [Streptomyces sp. NBC_01275]